MIDATSNRRRRPVGRTLIAGLPTYSSPTQPDVPVRFRASNEASVPPPESVIAAATAAAAHAHRYPKPHGSGLADALAQVLVDPTPAAATSIATALATATPAVTAEGVASVERSGR